MHKKFTDLLTGKVVQVTDQFEDIAILDGKQRIKLQKLMDGNLYDEYIDPMNFFRNESLVTAFAEKIRQLPNETPKTGVMESQRQLLNTYGQYSDYKTTPEDIGPAVLPYDPEIERQELIEKARKMFGETPINEGTRQLEQFKTILGDDDLNIDETIVSDDNNEIEEKPINRNYMTQPINQIQQTPPVVVSQQSMDPIIQMFRNVKRNQDFNIKFEINNKIPRLDFIEMMEDSYNTSIIDFLSEEFTNQILLNPQIIKNKIKDQIILMLHKRANQQPKQEPETKPTRRIRKKTEINTND